MLVDAELCTQALAGVSGLEADGPALAHGGAGYEHGEEDMRFIRPGEVVRMLGVSRTTLWRMVRAGLFPRPVEITERNRGYVLEDVEAWMQARVDFGRTDCSPTLAAVRRPEPVPVEAVAPYPARRRR